MEVGLAWIITTVVLPLITGATGWFTGRRKSDAEARKVEAEAKMVEAETRRQEITNEQSVVELYKSALADSQALNKAQMEELINMNQMQMDIQRKITEDLTATIDPMRKRIDHLEAAVKSLKAENAKLKQDTNQ